LPVWWEYLLVVVGLLLGAYGFAVLVGFQTRTLTRRTDRTAESMYPNYDGQRRRRRHRPG